MVPMLSIDVSVWLMLVRELVFHMQLGRWCRSKISSLQCKCYPAGDIRTFALKWHELHAAATEKPEHHQEAGLRDPAESACAEAGYRRDVSQHLSHSQLPGMPSNSLGSS